METVKRVLVNDAPHLLCKGPGIFIKEAYQDLQVGDRVSQIGKPQITKNNKTGVTSSNRFDQFCTPVEYVGTTMEIINEPTKALVFRIFPPDVTGMEEDECLYALYFINMDELIVPTIEDKSIRIYKSYFLKDDKINSNQLT